MISFPRSSVKQWEDFRNSPEGHNHKAYLRVGQSFFNWFNCHKVVGPDRVILDRLYERDGSEAYSIIKHLTDFAQ